MSSFKPVAAAVFSELKDHSLFQAIYEHMQCQVESPWSYSAAEELIGAPSAIVTAWRLWHFASGVAGNGLPDYFLNHCQSVEEAQAYLEALECVGACELTQMFRECAASAVAAEGEVAFLPEVEWFSSLSPAADPARLDELEAPSMELAAAPLSRLVANHLREAHQAGEI